MKRPASLKIHLSSPCEKVWEDLVENAEGRYCAQCDKTVIDFSTWSDRALVEFFSRQQGRICGNFSSSQLGRDISIPPQPQSRLYRMVIAMGLTLMFTRMPEANGQQVPGIENAGGEKSHADTKTIYGVVSDNEIPRLKGVKLTLTQHGKTIDKARSDRSGVFVFKSVPPGEYDIKAVYNKQYTITVKGINIHQSRYSTGMPKAMEVFMRFDRKGDKDVTQSYPQNPQWQPFIEPKFINVRRGLGGASIEIKTKDKHS